jgi:hypothetical protein
MTSVDIINICAHSAWGGHTGDDLEENNSLAYRPGYYWLPDEVKIKLSL